MVFKGESMRRKEREITDSEMILEIIKNSDVMRIGMCKDNVPYIVPLNFGYEHDNGAFTFYFHCAALGKKIDFINANNEVCLEFESVKELSPGESAMKCTYKYKSIIAYGKVQFLQSYEEKLNGINQIMHHYTGKKHDFTKEQIDIVTIGKITVDSLSAKQNGF